VEAYEHHRREPSAPTGPRRRMQGRVRRRRARGI